MMARAAAIGLGGLAVAQALPAVASWPALRRQLSPAVGGEGEPGHVAFTFDDGPDRRSTPHFLRLLRARGIHATFFLLGRMLRGNADVAADLVTEGHEIGLHGFDHRCLLVRGPQATYDDLARGRDAVARATGVVPRWWRPPYGVLTSAALIAAGRLDLTPVLWTAWGRDWSARATPQSVRRIVLRDLASGGTVLLHDSDCTSAPGSWRATLAALPGLLDHCYAEGWRVGPLRDHYRPRTDDDQQHAGKILQRAAGRGPDFVAPNCRQRSLHS
jgi:peptidoglycan/xylan/chitin deacetylase (PgdA/CDA1 family)